MGMYNQALNKIKHTFTTKEGYIDLARTTTEVAAGLGAEKLVHDEDQPHFGLRNLAFGVPAGMAGAAAGEAVFDYVLGAARKFRK